MSEEFLEHYGVKGMKWGVRRYQNRNGTLTTTGRNKYRQARQIKRAQKKWDRNFRRNWAKAYNKATERANDVLIPQINKKYKNCDFSKLDVSDRANPKGDPKLVSAYNKYMEEYQSRFNKILQHSYDEMFGKRPE